MRLVVLAAATFLSLASASPAEVAYQPVYSAAPVGVEAGDLFAASVRVFTDEGYQIQLADEVSGVVATHLRAMDDTIGDFDYRYGWRATIDGYTLQLAIDCKIAAHNGALRECDPERREDYVEQLPRVREAIFAEAQRRAARRGQ